VVVNPREQTPRASHGRSHAKAGDLWRLVNTRLAVDPRSMRVGCTIFLVAYGVIAGVRYHESHAFLLLRALVCAYAALGIRLSRDVTWKSIRAYTIGVTLFLPLQAAYIDGMLGNHIGEVGLTAVATFCALVFLQAGIDVAVMLPVLAVGHALVLAVVPAPVVPFPTVVMIIGAAMAAGASAAFQALIYRGRAAQSVVRVEEALAESAEWRHRYEAAIIASDQVLYDWNPRTDEVQSAGACERILGYSAAEMSGKLPEMLGLVHPDDRDVFTREVRRVVEEKSSYRIDYRFRRKDGVYIVVESNGHAILDDAGEIVRFIGFISDITERRRVEAARAEEAATSTALARVGRELISSLETPVVLDRLCRLTTEVLDCDFSSTWLWTAADGIYAPIAHYGVPPEHWETLRVLRLPSSPSAPLMARLTADDLAQVGRDDPRHPIMSGMLAHYDAQVVLCVPIRRRGEIVGVHTAGYSTGADAFTPAQERIALGIAQLASMALTNATLFEELERAGRLKSEFVSTMSHELRTPLNVIIGYTDILADSLTSAEQQTWLAHVRQSSLELLEMIEATLNLNRLQAGKDRPQIEPLPLANLWEDLRTEFDALPRAAPITLRWEPVGDTVLHTDRRKLKMIVKNIVGNALKFTPTGEIVVGCERDGDGTVIIVRDTGIGIPHEQLPHIFDMFRQVDSSDARSYGGAGLGLYIVSQLVEQLRGSVAVESEPGRGSTFRISLPSASAPTADVAA
jgi:PAS domain S-box-containing protein